MNSNSFNISKRNIDQINRSGIVRDARHQHSTAAATAATGTGTTLVSSRTATAVDGGSNTPTKTRRLTVSLPPRRRTAMTTTTTTTGASSSSSSSSSANAKYFSSPFVTPSFMTSSFMSSLPRRGSTGATASLLSSSASSSTASLAASLAGLRNLALPVLSPATYLAMSLKNKKLTTRIDPFSIEQALYFEPYTTGEIPLELLKALRTSNLERLRSCLYSVEEESKENETPSPTTADDDEGRREQPDATKHEEHTDKERHATTTTPPSSSSSSMVIIPKELRARNQFGENLVHIACRMGIFHGILTFLIDDARVPWNVRDKFGRTPLHNACMSAIPNFDNIYYLLKKAPKLLIFEDDKGKVPFDVIPPRCYERWTRFLSEKNILKHVATELASSTAAASSSSSSSPLGGR